MSNVITGTTTWGHSTGVGETNTRTFSGYWTGTGTISGSGDAEVINLNAGEYMDSEVVFTGEEDVALRQNYYDSSGDNVALYYRTAASETGITSVAWTEYTDQFASLGFVQVRLWAFTVWTVGTTVTEVDARTGAYAGIAAGDVINLTAGVHSPIEFFNIQGTAAHPITIINSGGLVEFTSSATEAAMYFKNCQHFRLTGTGDGGITYGIKITSFYSKAIMGTCKTDNAEVDHIKIMQNTAASGLGVHFLTYGLPAAYANSWNWDAYDYNNDSVLEGVDGQVYTMENIKIHDCHFDGTVATYNLDMPIYVGYSEYTSTPHTRDLYDAGHTLQTGVTVYYPPTDNVEIYNNIIEHNISKCIQVGACLTSCLIHDNVLNDVCHGATQHWPAISINPACSGVEIYNNRMIDFNNGIPIYSYGETVKVYNNVIINPGYYGMILGALKPAGYHHYKSQWVLNNTIVSSYGAQCVAFSASEGTDDRIQNNILINTGGWYIDASPDVVGNNYQNATVANAKFTDEPNDDYSLAADSPCLNGGTDLTAYGVTDDIVGTARPQGVAYDQGAYERVV